MYVVQILLPIFDNQGRAFSDSQMAAVREELVTEFGGITAFTRTPAKGVWADRGEKMWDELILVEVMVEIPDRSWWKRFRIRLEDNLSQKTIMIRASNFERL